ncbi:MAG: thermonuclease family protein [Actinomycetota bacterium]
MSATRVSTAALLIAAVLSACARQSSGRPSVSPGTQTGPRPPAAAFAATIERVVDGDTVIARRTPGGAKVRVRLIGIDSPETVKPGTPQQCYGPEASAYLAAALRGARITASYEGGGHLDKFGRDLWDIWLADGTFVAGQEVERGYARALRVRPQVDHAAYLSGVEAGAKAGRRGLWGACPR